MKVLFDATWIAQNANVKVMHGGLRVVYELCKRLVKTDEVDTYLTHTTLNSLNHKNLIEFVKKEYKIDKSRIKANLPLILKMHQALQRKIPKLRGGTFLTRRIDFIRKKELNEFAVYHSPVGAIPKLVNDNKKITPFFTALDLIPFVRPDIAPWWYIKYGKLTFDSLTSRTIFLAISESTRNDLLNYRKDVKPENVVVTYIAADRNIFYVNKNEEKKKKVLEKYNIKYEKYFFALNRLERYKNIEHVLDSFNTLTLQGYLKDVGFVLIGTLSEDGYHQEVVKKYSNNKQIQFIEYVEDEDLSVIYSNATGFIYMSLYEGFGLPILEAMQCGVPVICSNTSSMPEVIGNAGICIDPTDKDLLCESILKIYNDSALAAKYAGLGLERSQQFSWDKYAVDVVNAYKRFTD